MTYNDFHIADFSSHRTLSIKIFVLGLCSAFIVKVTKRFWFRTGAFKSMVKSFDRIDSNNIDVLKILQSGEDIPREKAFEAHAKSEKVLKKLISIHHEFEKDNFFGSHVLEQSFEKALLSFYRVEAHLRVLVTKEVSCAEQDASLIEFASNISLGSLHA